MQQVKTLGLAILMVVAFAATGRAQTLGTLDANFDIYNAFNSDAVLTETTTYSGVNGGAWLLPTSVIVDASLNSARGGTSR
jgi:hypothetical protein